MSTSLVTWNLNITEYYPEILLQVGPKQETKTDERGHEIFSEKITGPWNIYVYGLLGYKIFFQKFVKHPPAPPPTYLMYAPLVMKFFNFNQCFKSKQTRGEIHRSY